MKITEVAREPVYAIEISRTDLHKLHLILQGSPAAVAFERVVRDVLFPPQEAAYQPEKMKP